MAFPIIKERIGVYYPREDSFILADAVGNMARGEVLDLGTGSGIQGIVAALRGGTVTFCDIDPLALASARANASANEVSGTFIISDLFYKIDGKFDTIIFNPPYLPSGKKEVEALDGGRKGRELIDRFLKEYRSHLRPGGIALLLESSLNGYENEVEKGAKIIAKAHYFFEDLVVLELL